MGENIFGQISGGVAASHGITNQIMPREEGKFSQIYLLEPCKSKNFPQQLRYTLQDKAPTGLQNSGRIHQ